eukprot:8514202-Pyramimonas_sp.AAC.1
MDTKGKNVDTKRNMPKGVYSNVETKGKNVDTKGNMPKGVYDHVQMCGIRQHMWSTEFKTSHICTYLYTFVLTLTAMASDLPARSTASQSASARSYNSQKDIVKGNDVDTKGTVDLTVKTLY